MVYTNLIVGFIVIISVIIGFIVSKVLNSDKEQDIPNLFISAGFGLITSSFATTRDKIIDIFNNKKKRTWMDQNREKEFIW